MERTGFSIDNQIEISTNRMDSDMSIEAYALEAFRLVNFKAFNDTGWIKLNRLTLLLGANSSGKSALYQALQMLPYAYEKMMQEELGFSEIL